MKRKGIFDETYGSWTNGKNTRWIVVTVLTHRNILV
jgi:hypothetical protein